MKKQDVITLIGLGLLSVSAHELGPEQAYKVFQMKRSFERAHKAISEESEAILKESGIDEGFRQKVADINNKGANKEALTIEEREWVTKANNMQLRADKLLRKMYEAEATLDPIKTVSFETWRELQKENRAKEINGKTMDILGGQAEMLLADIFWQAPEEKVEKAEEAPKKSKK